MKGSMLRKNILKMWRTLGNNVRRISLFPARAMHTMIQIQCSVMVLMWHVGSAICPSPAIHIITTCCLDSWALSVMRSGDIQAYFAIAYLATGGLLISAGPVLSGGDRSPQHVRPIVWIHLHLWSMNNDRSNTAKYNAGTQMHRDTNRRTS